MSTETVLLIAVVTMALLFDVMNGFHDGCNAVSTVIYTGALKPRTAIMMSAAFTFLGPLVMGIAVAKTIGGVIDASDASAHLVIAALFGALLWDLLTWIWALPVSSSHALVGGLLGAGLAAMGSSGIIWDRVILILVSLVVSPFLGLLTGYFFMFVTQRIVRLVKWDLDKADKFYKRMQILSAAWVSFSHGSNDATKVMGMIVLFLASSHQLTVDGYIDKFGFPLWVILSAAAAMALGTYLDYRSMRIIRTVGERLCNLHPVNGFSAEVGGAVIIQLASFLGLPVSTTHIVTSSVTGTGLRAGLTGVSWKVFRAIILAWVITLPFCAGVAAAMYYLLNIWL